MLFALPAAFLAGRVSRPMVIMLGCIIWGAGLIACGMAEDWSVVLVGRMLNGVGLGLVKPLVFSLVADKNRPSKRGMAMGMLFFSSAVGNTIFTSIATAHAESMIFGHAGWRFWCVIVGALSGLLGMIVACAVTEPNSVEARSGGTSVLGGICEGCRNVWQLFKYPTFVLLCVQGGPGSMPWYVVPNFTQWLELLCFSNAQAARTFLGFNIGNILSCLTAGLALDYSARRFPSHGPPTIANFSSGMGTPALIVIFYLLPKPGEGGPSDYETAAYTIVMFFTGLFVSMCGPVNSKVFTDIVPKHILTYAYALDTVLEGVIGSLGPLGVGFISDNLFHLDEDAAQSGVCNPEVGAALGNSMFTVFQVGWGACFIVYLGMQFTYPIDYQRSLAAQQETHRNAPPKESIDRDHGISSGEIGSVLAVP
eukprot:TRINITY_DN2421_c0_g1_i3.p1 TRINITY_DN2421_c0_g1~~TRINITY_DN2421_c0_g1_i3.p1  ORF type:complete len:423 (+),score=34.64 TRINITY_DN2421_c0_g1_i3:280-1548(+)